MTRTPGRHPTIIRLFQVAHRNTCRCRFFLEGTGVGKAFPPLLGIRGGARRDAAIGLEWAIGARIFPGHLGTAGEFLAADLLLFPRQAAVVFRRVVGHSITAVLKTSGPKWRCQRLRVFLAPFLIFFTDG